MLPRWLLVLLMLLAEAWSARREARIGFLLAQIEMLRARMPGNRVIVSPEERARLLKLGAAMGHDVDDLIGIVNVKTYRRWLREKADGQAPGRVGRRRVIPASLRALILRLARENTGWGVRRIVGELKKLALPSSRSTVRRVLVDEGVLPDPDRRAPKGVTTPWRTFVDMHLNTMVACDLFLQERVDAAGQTSCLLPYVHPPREQEGLRLAEHLPPDRRMGAAAGAQRDDVAGG